ncbi:PREDICTED: uncharacterized protein LOC106119433 [Papilio xuthus]|uniref:Uncharacterized protein LOC106119433 n=1 Tax=Papilio xuthus TaxID=66420 RepID=A0AAJ6ZCU8_PAPXU|nr:PREDICTED: uncharacterized protein LOC106119433 [Papilio xuthus]
MMVLMSNKCDNIFDHQKSASNWSEEESSYEDLIVFPNEVEDESQTMKDRYWKTVMKRSRSNNDLIKRGYKQSGLTFSSPSEEHNYFLKIYKNLSQAKCFQYKNELLRQRFLKEEEGVGHGVVGGKDTTAEQHPYMGALGFELTAGKPEFLCACTLISHYFALTAAHCSSKVFTVLYHQVLLDSEALTFNILVKTTKY